MRQTTINHGVRSFRRVVRRGVTQMRMRVQFNSQFTRVATPGSALSLVDPPIQFKVCDPSERYTREKQDFDPRTDDADETCALGGFART